MVIRNSFIVTRRVLQNFFTSPGGKIKVELPCIQQPKISGLTARMADRT